MVIFQSLRGDTGLGVVNLPIQASCLSRCMVYATIVLVIMVFSHLIKFDHKKSRGVARIIQGGGGVQFAEILLTTPTLKKPCPLFAN